MQSRILTILTTSTILGSCFKVPVSSEGKVSSDQAISQLVEAVTVSENKYKSAIDPNATTDQQLTAPSISGLQGASVSISPGSLGISAELIVEQASDFSDTSITNEMGLADDIQVSNTSPGMIIRPTEDVDLKKPLSLAMPLPTSLGMRLTAGEGSRYAIFYKYFDPTEARLVTGMKVVDGVSVRLSFDEKSGKDLIAFEGYFGAYWAAILSREVKVAEVPPPKPAEEPIINVAKVSVIETKGIVKESEIVVKQQIQIPETTWQKPLLVKGSQERSVRLTAVASRPLTACKVDFFESTRTSSGLSLEAPLGPDVEISPSKKTEHTLFGRFRCNDDQGRFTVSPWSEQLTIAAVPVEPVASAPVVLPQGVCNDADHPLIKLREPVQSQLVDIQDFAYEQKCVYSTDIFVHEGGNAYIVIGDNKSVCGLASHALLEGSQTLACKAATQAAVGGDFISVPPGNYKLRLDFSKSESNPTANLSKLPCDMGNFYALFSSGDGFESKSETNRMKHMGACQFTLEKREATASLITSTDRIRIVNEAGNLYCGNISSSSTNITSTSTSTSSDNFSRFLSPGHRLENICSDVPMHFSFFESFNAPAHIFTLSLGPSAKEDASPSTTSQFRYEVDSACPRELFIYGPTAAGQQAIHGVNSAYRQGVCKYQFAIAADSSAVAADYKFHIGNESKSVLCGSHDPSVSWSADCSAGVPAFTPSSIVQGNAYKVTVNGSGDGAAMQLNDVSLTSVDAQCYGGLYLADKINGGVVNSSDKAFAEVNTCVFEKNWAPKADNLSFYLADGSGSQFCGSDGDPSLVPTLGGAPVGIRCHGASEGVSELLAIRPLQIQAGQVYKIRVDQRFRNIDGMARVQVSAASTAGCGDDLHFLSDQLPTGATLSTSNKMVNLGNCSYAFTFDTPQNTSQMSYLIKTANGVSCGRNESAVNPGLNMSSSPSSGPPRSVKLLCSAGFASLQLSTSSIGPRTLRFFVKKESNGDMNLTLQDLSYPGMNCDSSSTSMALAGQGGNAISDPEARKFSKASAPGVCRLEYLWNPTASSSFTLAASLGQGGFSSTPTACGLAPNAENISAFGTANLVCGIPSGGEIRAIGPLSAQPYLLSLVFPKTVESPIQLKVAAGQILPAPVSLAWLGGSQDVRSPGITSGPDAEPSARKGAVTWTDAAQKMWLFGGYAVDPGTPSVSGYANDLWKYDPVTAEWAHIKGPLSLNDSGTFNDSPTINRPSARRDSLTWYDEVNNRLYLFGGLGFPSIGSGEGVLNDLWYYSIGSGDWVYVNGSHEMSDIGSYGTLNNLAQTGNQPPARAEAVAWKKGRELWVFGGYFRDSNPGQHSFNDLWSYDIDLNRWTWRGGSNIMSQSSVAGSTAQISGRSGAVAWYDASENAAYVYGGLGYGPSSPQLWKLQISTLAWTLKFDGSFNNSMSTVTIPLAFTLFTAPNPNPEAAWSYDDGLLWLMDSDGKFFAYQKSTGRWAFASSANNFSNQPNYGNGSLSTDNRIGALASASFWQTANGPMIFGGEGTGSNFNFGPRNSLWFVELP